MIKWFSILISDIRDWAKGWYIYLEKKLTYFGRWFEKDKSILVDVLMARRGTYQQSFLRFSLGILFMAGVVAAPVLADSYPGAIPSTLAAFTPPSAVLTSFDQSDYGVQTKVSEKPRDQVISYKVASGDTLSSIASKFGISVDTIRWANILTDDELSVGDTLKIPPVTGVVIKVADGETIYSIAKKYKTDAQKIVNFPFNDFADPDTFALTAGQTLVVPDGVMPQAPAIAYLPTVFVNPIGTGVFLWPTNGLITQCPVWYHNAFDIANPSEPGVMAADDGVVISVGYERYGYGSNIIVSHGGNLSTLYAHLTEYYVKIGDKVTKGQVIGRMGTSGRSTGPHLHFEVRVNGSPIRPNQFFTTSCGG